jgi:hypothetical protein
MLCVESQTQEHEKLQNETMVQNKNCLLFCKVLQYSNKDIKESRQVKASFGSTHSTS